MEAAVVASRKRPKLVWTITTFYVISVTYTGLSYYLIFSGVVPLNAAQAEYFASLTAIDHGMTILNAAANFLGAGYLFAMRRQAPYLFTAGLAMGVFLSVWQAVRNGWLSAIGGSGLVGALIGWAIAFAICVYSWRLLRQNELR